MYYYRRKINVFMIIAFIIIFLIIYDSLFTNKANACDDEFYGDGDAFDDK